MYNPLTVTRIAKNSARVKIPGDLTARPRMMRMASSGAQVGERGKGKKRASATVEQPDTEQKYRAPLFSRTHAWTPRREAEEEMIRDDRLSSWESLFDE